MHHDQSDGLEDDAAALENESDETEFDFPDGGDHDADYDEGDVEEDFHVWGCDSETPCYEEDDDRHRGLRYTVRVHCSDRCREGTTDLQHLNKGYAQI